MSPLFLASILLCMVAGAVLDLSRICLVRAAGDVADGKPAVAIGVLVATAAASIVFYLSTAFGFAPRIATWAYPHWSTLLGAVIFAAGSLVNGACPVGTLARIARGDVGHLATFAGALSIAILVPYSIVDRGAAVMSPVSGESWLGAILAFTALMMVLGRRHLRQAGLGSYLALGLTAAIVTSWRGNWTWMGVVQQVQSGLPVQYETIACVVAFFLGAALVVVLRGRFHYIPPNPRTMLREATGGALMLIGAVLIPGSNDALSLYGVPSGSPNAVAGIVIMFVVMVAVLWWRQNRVPLGGGAKRAVA